MKINVPAVFRSIAIGLAAVATVAAVPVAAQTYPDRPIRFIVGWPAGGAGDAAARLLGQQLRDRLKQPIVVDNRPGANGRIGANLTAKSEPDGYTMTLAGAEKFTINPVLYADLPYNPTKDFAMVAPYAVIPFAVVVKGDISASSMRDVVASAKASPGKLTSASWGVGSTSHLILEVIKAQAGIDILHIPFQGEAPAVGALMGGQVDMMVMPAIRAAQLRQDGRVKVLAVTTKNRVGFIGDVPTLMEQGYNVDVANWLGVAMPAKTPREIVEKMASEINAVQKTQAFADGLVQIGMYPHPPMSTTQFHKFIEDDIKRWEALVQAAKISIN